MKKKVLAAVLSSAMVLSCTGPVYAEGEDVVTLTVRGTDVGIIDGFQENDVMAEVEKRLGVKVEWVSFDAQRDAVALAGGDLPDIMQISAPDFQTYVDGGHILELDELIEEYGSDIKTNAPQMLEFCKKYASFGNDKTYGLTASNYLNAEGQSVYNYGVGFLVRWDYYKELGYPEINSTDDYLNVLAQMQEAHPTTEEGKKVYAMGAWSDWGLWPYIVPYGFSQGYLNSTNSTLLAANGEEVPIFAEDSVYKEAMKFLNKANSMGLIDPESFVQKQENYVDKAKNLQYLTLTSDWWNADINAVFRQKGIENAGYYIIPGSTPHVYENNGSAIAGLLADRYLAISSSCEHPEKAMEFLNFMYSEEGNRLFRSGIEGVHWENVDGSPEMKEEVLEQKRTDTEFARKTGIGLYLNLCGLSDSSKNANGELFDLSKTPKAIAANVTDADKDFCEKYGVSYPGEAFANAEKDGKTSMDFYDVSYASLVEPMSSDLQMIDGKVGEYAVTFTPKLILADDEEEFEEIWAEGLEELEEMGLSTLVDWRLAQVKTAQEKVSEITK